MTREAFTIGNEAVYEEVLRGEDDVIKIGFRPDLDPPYPGGWVWRTREAAQAFIDANPDLGFKAKVYGLVLPVGWHLDVSRERDPESGAYHLVHDALVIPLEVQR